MSVAALVMRPFLRPLVAMVVSLAVGAVSSGLLWWLCALLVPWVVYVVMRFGKYVVLVSVALVVAFFLLDVIAHETEALDATLDWAGTQAGLLADTGVSLHAQLCAAWPRLPAAVCAPSSSVVGGGGAKKKGESDF